MTRQYRIAIVEDHVLQRARTEELINSDDAFRTVYSGESMPAFITWLRTAPTGERPDLLVLDLMVERKPSVDVAMVRRMLEGGLRIVVLSAMASPPLVRSIVTAGVTAVVGKRDAEEDILAAIHATLRGEGWVSPELAAILAGDANRPRLSVQEEQTLILYASGLTIGQVAEALNIGTETARQYLSRVRRKYVESGVAASTKLDLVKIAWRDGYVDPLA